MSKFREYLSEKVQDKKLWKQIENDLKDSVKGIIEDDSEIMDEIGVALTGDGDSDKELDKRMKASDKFTDTLIKNINKAITDTFKKA